MGATIRHGTAFFAFPFTSQELTDPEAGTTWWVVIQEALDHPRFGCDDPGDTRMSAPPAAWQELSWSHLQFADPVHADDPTRSVLHVPLDGPLNGIRRHVGAAPDPAGPIVQWAADSASMAVIVQQPAARVRIPISLWLT